VSAHRRSGEMWMSALRLKGRVPVTAVHTTREEWQRKQPGADLGLLSRVPGRRDRLHARNGRGTCRGARGGPRDVGASRVESEGSFAATLMEYLGHELTQEGIKPTTRLVKSTVDFPVPQDDVQVRRFVALAGYYRRFVPALRTGVRRQDGDANTPVEEGSGVDVGRATGGSFRVGKSLVEYEAGADLP
jgi:hypothetical protein